MVDRPSDLPSKPSLPPQDHIPKQTQATPTYKETTGETSSSKKDSSEGGTFMGMQMNKKQYQKFLSNMMNDMINQIKSDQASYDQTQQQILQDEQEEDG